MTRFYDPVLQGGPCNGKTFAVPHDGNGRRPEYVQVLEAEPPPEILSEEGGEIHGYRRETFRIQFGPELIEVELYSHGEGHRELHGNPLAGMYYLATVMERAGLTRED